MKVELMFITPNAMELIESCARTSYMSFNKVEKGSSIPFIKKLIKSKHESVLEHASATFRISGISRVCSHQLVRHRLASYTQKSQRRVKEKYKDVYIPVAIREKNFETKLFNEALESIYNCYETLISRGIKLEDARYILPNAQKTEITMTANFREWRHILLLRVSKFAEEEIRFLASRILEILYKKYPIIFEDIYEKMTSGD